MFSFTDDNNDIAYVYYLYFWERIGIIYNDKNKCDPDITIYTNDLKPIFNKGTKKINLFKLKSNEKNNIIDFINKLKNETIIFKK